MSALSLVLCLLSVRSPLRLWVRFWAGGDLTPASWVDVLRRKYVCIMPLLLRSIPGGVNGKKDVCRLPLPPRSSPGVRRWYRASGQRQGGFGRGSRGETCGHFRGGAGRPAPIGARRGFGRRARSNLAEALASPAIRRSSATTDKGPGTKDDSAVGSVGHRSNLAKSIASAAIRRSSATTDKGPGTKDDSAWPSSATTDKGPGTKDDSAVGSVGWSNRAKSSPPPQSGPHPRQRTTDQGPRTIPPWVRSVRQPRQGTPRPQSGAIRDNGQRTRDQGRFRLALFRDNGQRTRDQGRFRRGFGRQLGATSPRAFASPSARLAHNPALSRDCHSQLTSGSSAWSIGNSARSTASSAVNRHLATGTWQIREILPHNGQLTTDN